MWIAIFEERDDRRAFFSFCGEQLSMGGPKKEHLEVVELDYLQVFGEGHLFLFKYCSQF